MVRVTAQTVLGLIFLTSGALAMPAFLEEPSLIPTAAKPAPTTESQAPVPTPTAGSPAPLDIPLSALEAAPVLDAAADLDAPAPNNGSLTKRTGPFTCYPGITGNAPLQDFVWLGGAQKACTTWFGPNMNQVHYVLEGSTRSSVVPLGGTFPTLRYSYWVKQVSCISYPVYVPITGNKCIEELKSIINFCPNERAGYNPSNPLGIWFGYSHS